MGIEIWNRLLVGGFVIRLIVLEFGVENNQRKIISIASVFVIF